MRSLARLLLADARRAAIAGDGATVVADLTAAISMSQQIYEPKSSLVEQLVGIAVFGYAMEIAGRILAETPAVLTDEQLRELAHRIAAYHDGTVPVDFNVEQMYFDDLLQRAYTDDGQGNGRMTPAGLVDLADYRNADMALFRAPKNNEAGTFAANLFGPGVSALVGSRQENRELYQSLIDEGIRLHQGPPWLWDQQAIDTHRDRLQTVAKHPTQRIRYVWVFTYVPCSRFRVRRRRAHRSNPGRGRGCHCAGALAAPAWRLADEPCATDARPVAGRAARSGRWPAAALRRARWTSRCSIASAETGVTTAGSPPPMPMMPRRFDSGRRRSGGTRRASPSAIGFSGRRFRKRRSRRLEPVSKLRGEGDSPILLRGLRKIGTVPAVSKPVLAAGVVQRGVVDDPGGRPVAVVAADHVEEERVQVLAAQAIGKLRRDVVLGRQVLDAGVGVVVHLPIGRKRHAQRPPAQLGDARPGKSWPCGPARSEQRGRIGVPCRSLCGTG